MHPESIHYNAAVEVILTRAALPVSDPRARAGLQRFEVRRGERLIGVVGMEARRAVAPPALAGRSFSLEARPILRSGVRNSRRASGSWAARAGPHSRTGSAPRAPVLPESGTPNDSEIHRRGTPPNR